MTKLSAIEWLAIVFLCIGTMVAQDTAQDVKAATVKTGHAIGHGGKAIGKGTKKGLTKVEHGTTAGATGTAKGTKIAAAKTGDGVKDAVKP